MCETTIVDLFGAKISNCVTGSAGDLLPLVAKQAMLGSPRLGWKNAAVTPSC